MRGKLARKVARFFIFQQNIQLKPQNKLLSLTRQKSQLNQT